MGARTLNKLTAIQAIKLSAPGRHSDGGGLYLFIDNSGRRRWIFMYTRHSKRIELGLGSGRDLSLAAARTEAAVLRSILAHGGDPKAERAKLKGIPTFGEMADAHIEAMTPSWRNPKHIAQWKMTLTEYAKPIRHRPVDEIDTQEILELLQPLWKRTPETAERLRGRIENVLNAAKAKGYRWGENPAAWRGHLDQLLPKRQRLMRGHHAALPYEAIPAFMTDLRLRTAVAARALEFTILSAARSGEVLGMHWEELDHDKKLWTIPASRMKMGREHRVPLSPRAWAIIEGQAAVSTKGYVFLTKPPDKSPPEVQPTKPLSSMAMSMLLRRMKAGVTVHGFRSSFRDWAAESTGFPHEVCEMALAHTIANKAEAAYRRGDLFQKRRKLMEAWAGFCTGLATGMVVPIQKSAAT
jgi:integrase